ncbi:hypothetical protein [Oryzibacter oryziterrae]|uniref:hypothetical protein n=1 Tax=Oryzibacter oryziterrae TaxID=2766474 RepID=UPI001F2EE30B|nr:hypothetical protein [Oryzibacter oryziterrae]
MQTKLTILAITCLLSAPALTSAMATDQAPAGPKDGVADTFAFAPADGPQLRIDRRDGTVSLCEQTAGQWACKLVADDRKAYEDRLSEVEAENARLAARVSELERKLADSSPMLGSSDQQKLDEFLDLSDRMFHHFFNMVEDLKRQENKPI